MWNRKELKKRAKLGVKRNYWKSVLVSLIFVMIVGGMGFMGGIGGSFIGTSSNSGMTPELESAISAASAAVLPIVGVIAIIVVVFVIFSTVALINPFSVGVYKYSLNAVRGEGNVSDLGNGFDVSYKRNVKVMFFYDIYIILWMILFIIPGIIKVYEYKMVPYLLADNPEMNKAEIFKTSKAMMKGNKWRAFVLDLSFILWNFLSCITFGLVEIFWVEPYKLLTNAALYDALKQN